ncbi:MULTISPECIES: DUF768 domain-containing protein [unclassified Mesorhizobium]|uniref:DUF768 domain-containing protein n=1 Tax=unclassified Mesorhizobium TaxID=325217 RepID=UPI0003CE3D66|nr:DUF768 domain-containing protein [Mesorhizobium sp. LSHC420B00]ESX70601.1 hypothetical protein X759_22045 [Mesorhizobium sp. LSHC420B00]
MSDSAIEFLQDWIHENVHVPPPPIRLEREAEILARECEEEAADAGVPIEDIEEEVGDLKDLLVAKLEDAAEDEARHLNGDGQRASMPAAEQKPSVQSRSGAAVRV